LSESFELPSLEEVQEMERQRKQSIESLEISDGKVKCQKCGIAVPIVGKMNRPANDRVVVLQKRIYWLETRYRSGNPDNLKALKTERSFQTTFPISLFKIIANYLKPLLTIS
jgi:hypothetical protein